MAQPIDWIDRLMEPIMNLKMLNINYISLTKWANQKTKKNGQEEVVCGYTPGTS